jgi:hypothetical protein
MKCLSIRQPWATLVILGAKRVENRSWPTDHRGPLLIHASAKLECDWNAILEPGDPIEPDQEVQVDNGRFVLPAINSLPLSAIIGVVNLVDCRRFEDLPKELQDHPFAQEGSWCWILEDGKQLDKPYPCKGKLRLWDSPPELKLS